MKWKNVARLISVDTKSGRLLRSREFRKYREDKFLKYLLYIGAVLVGIAIAVVVLNIYVATTDELVKQTIRSGITGFFLSFPSLIFIYSLVLTLMGQIQRMGVKTSIQPPYWLPITWSEHTLAAIISILLGIPLASILLIGSIVAVLSIFLGEVPLAIFTILASFASAFMASTTTEIFRVLQIRLVGAVYKSSGKAAIWIRFLGTMLFIIIFYLIWFSLTSGMNSIAIIGEISSLQRLVWFIPYVWLGTALYSFFSGLLIDTLIFSISSILFIIFLFYTAVKLNTKYGLYEPPAITVSRGVYSPRAGFLGKLGFSSLEAAIMRKDFKAFTRRRELMYIFIMPIVFVIVPLMQSFGAAATTPQRAFSQLFFSAWILLIPGPATAVIMGEMILGEEGGAVWHFFSSPISARNLLKCKYSLVAVFSFLVTAICSIIGIVLYQPSAKVIAVSLIESVFLIVTLVMVSVESGIRGADFVEIPRPRMIRPWTALANFVLCLIAGSVILAPLLPHVAAKMGLPITLAQFDLYISLILSGLIASAITYIFYRLALKRARDFLINAET
jgi:hypothetical protein